MEHERFVSLVLPHTQAMARVAAALIGLADAEDAAQEALVRAWNGWATLRPVVTGYQIWNRQWFPFSELLSGRVAAP